MTELGELLAEGAEQSAGEGGELLGLRGGEALDELADAASNLAGHVDSESSSGWREGEKVR